MLYICVQTFDVMERIFVGKKTTGPIECTVVILLTITDKDEREKR
jgi:hypothetical protein